VFCYYLIVDIVPFGFFSEKGITNKIILCSIITIFHLNVFLFIQLMGVVISHMFKKPRRWSQIALKAWLYTIINENAWKRTFQL
jgi:hypothetical protein